MLFIIDDSMAEALNQPNPSDEVVIALEKIAHAYRQGQHLVFVNRNTLERLIACQLYSKPTQSLYSHILRRLGQSGIRPGMFISEIKVVAERGIFESYNNGKCKGIRLSADYVSKRLITSPTIFLCENLNDIKLYERIAQVHLMKQNLDKRLYLRYERWGGGGSTTAEQYEIIRAEKQRLCLTIVDSDRAAPDTGEGGTAQRIKKSDEQPLPLTKGIAETKDDEGKKQGFCKLLPLNVRMVENLIPITLYEKALDIKDPLQETIGFMKQLKPEARQYIHFKKGLMLEEILSLPSENLLVKYWLDNLQDLPLPKLKSSNPCWVQKKCQHEKKCECSLIKGFGPQILNTTTNFIATQSDSELANLIDEPLKSEWDYIGQLITAWCCAGESVLTL